MSSVWRTIPIRAKTVPRGILLVWLLAQSVLGEQPPLRAMASLPVPQTQTQMQTQTQTQTNPTPPPSMQKLSIRVAGSPQSVWSSLETWKKCHAIDIPDTPARAFVVDEGDDKPARTTSFESKSNSNSNLNSNLNSNSNLKSKSKSNSTIVRMVTGAVGYHEMQGPTLFEQTRSCRTAWNATRNPDPSMFAGNEFLDTTVSFGNGTVVALVHTEFPGDLYNACTTTSLGENHWNGADPLQRRKDSLRRPRPRNQYQYQYHYQYQYQYQYHSPRRRRLDRSRRGRNRVGYPRCWTVSLGLAVSHDFGRTWEHASEPPRHLVAAVPYKYNETQLASGWGDPSNVLRVPSNANANAIRRTRAGSRPGTDEDEPQQSGSRDEHEPDTTTDGCNDCKGFDDDYDYDDDDGVYDKADNGVDSPDDGDYYYVAMWNRNPVGAQPAGICIARTRHLLDPTSWRAWNGTDYSVRFANPYDSNTENDGDDLDPREHVCQTTTIPGIPSVRECTIYGLVRREDVDVETDSDSDSNSDFDHEQQRQRRMQRQNKPWFVATIGCLGGSSLYVSTSRDRRLQDWSAAEKLYGIADLPPEVAAVTTRMWYPSLLDPEQEHTNHRHEQKQKQKHEYTYSHAYRSNSNSNSNGNFDAIGRRPYLFWASLGHSPHTDGRHLWATPLEMELQFELESELESEHGEDGVDPKQVQVQGEDQ